MIILVTVLITLLVIVLLACIILKLGMPYARDILHKSTEICCYVNTYHYDKCEVDRIKIGKDLLYKTLQLKDKYPISRDKSDFIFWALYTQFYNKLLDTVPIYITKYHNRTLSEGEERGTAKFLDGYLAQQEKEFEKYATEDEIARRKASNICETKNSDIPHLQS